MAGVKKQKKERKKINPLDVVIVLLVLCLIAAFAYRLYDGINTPSLENDSEYVVYFECHDEYNSMIKYLEEGDAVYLAASGELLGNLYTQKADGAVVSIIGDGEGDEEYSKVDFSGKLGLSSDAEAVSAGNYYTVGDVNFAKGSEIEVYTERASFTITVTDVKPIE